MTEAESGETLVQELEIATDTYEDNYDTPSEAGFVLSDGSSANVIFGVMNGVLSITGINY